MIFFTVVVMNRTFSLHKTMLLLDITLAPFTGDISFTISLQTIVLTIFFL